MISTKVWMLTVSDKSLSDKAIQIQGKDYVLVSDRIIYFNEHYPKGSIKTELITDPLADIVVVLAIVDTGNGTSFTGHSQAVKGAGFINKTAALENAETSAVGRALAMMGIGVIDSVASADEVNKAKGTDSGVVEAKQRLYQAFKDHSITDTGEMITKIERATGKTAVETLGDVAKVIKLLESDNE